MDPNQVDWEAMGWAMPAEVLAAAKYCEGGVWNWGGMAGAMAAKARETTEVGAEGRVQRRGARVEDGGRVGGLKRGGCAVWRVQ